MADFDAVFVGSGINSLCGAALLSKGGWRVCVLERNPWLGGNIRTEEITEPGFRHDLYSGWHPLFVGSEAYKELKEDLRRHGLEYLNTDYPTGTLFPDGRAVFLSTDQDRNVKEFTRFGLEEGTAWEEMMADFTGKAQLAFAMLGTELWSRQGLGLAWRAFRQLGRDGVLEFTAQLLSSSRHFLEERFRSPELHGLLAPWVLHTGLGPEDAGSGFMTQILAAALQMGGMPVPKGGGARLVEALAQVIREGGGRLETEADVERVLVENGRAVGIRLRGGSAIRARRAVICNVTPTQLYLRLLDRQLVPPTLLAKARHYRYGRADMQIHLALSEPPRWPEGDERFHRTAILHVTGGLNAVSKAVNEAERGLLPAEATIVVGQPLAVDPSRAPEGSWILWIQLQELPRLPQGDAAGEIPVKSGEWTETLREAYADRILRRLSRLIPNLESSLRKRVVLSPADLEAANINLVGGDPYSGACVLNQFFLWRPLPGLPRHRTPIRRLYHIGASTHPGPGLHGASGTMVAKELLAKTRWK